MIASEFLGKKCILKDNRGIESIGQLVMSHNELWENLLLSITDNLLLNLILVRVDADVVRIDYHL